MFATTWRLLLGALIYRLKLPQRYLLFILQLFIETVEEFVFFFFFDFRKGVLIVETLQLLKSALRFNHFIDAVKYDVSRLTNLLWAGVLKFQVGALHKLLHELMYTLLLRLQVLFNVV